MASRKPKRLSPMRKRIAELEAEVDRLRRHNLELCSSNQTFVEHARTLTRESNNLRRMQLMAKLTVADHDNVRNSIATVRAEQAEINARLATIAALFEIETKKPETVTNMESPPQ